MKRKAKFLAYALASVLSVTNAKNINAEGVIDKEDIMLEDYLEKQDYIKANDNICIREMADDKSNIIGFLNVNEKLPYNATWNEYYEVRYNGKIGFVNSKDVDLISEYDFENIAVFKNNTTLYNDSDEKIEIEKDSVGKYFRDIGSYSLVEYEGVLGCVKKEDLDLVSGVFVVVDISDQRLYLYEDDNVIYECPIISGKKRTPSTIGNFTVYQKRYDTNLIGPGYSSHVDVFMKYHNGEGLHDAYRWRSDSEYLEKDRYINNGSHGCINMRKDDALYISDYVDVGTRVLVKK